MIIRWWTEARSPLCGAGIFHYRFYFTMFFFLFFLILYEQTITNHYRNLQFIAIKSNCLISYRAGAWYYLIFPDFLNSGFKWLPKQTVKQRALCAVKTILRARLLQKLNILHQRTVVLLLWRSSIKPWEKKDLIGDFRYLEVLEGFPNCSTKNLNKEPSSLALFTALDPTEYWGMIREWVYLFLQTVK